MALTICIAVVNATAAEPKSAASAADLANQNLFAERVLPFLKQHCFECHGAKVQKGKLRLDTLPAEFRQAENARHWLEVMDRMNLGEMPPDDQPRPEIHELRMVTGWIAAQLRQAERAAIAGGGRVLLRRLNRTEYANTVRDLLGITFMPGESPLDILPPDGKLEGFDKTSAALMFDPSLLDKYYDVAQRVAEASIVTGPPEFPTLAKRFEFENTIKTSAFRYLAFLPGWITRENDAIVMSGAARTFGVLYYGKTQRMIPTKGFYRIRVRAAAEMGDRHEPIRMEVRRTGEGALLETVVDAPPDNPKIYEAVVPLQAAGGNELETKLLNGTTFTLYTPAYGALDKAVQDAGQKKDFAAALRMMGRQTTEGLTQGSRPNPDALDLKLLPKLYLDWIEIEGPVYDDWPPKSHQRIFFRGEGATQDLAYAREIFERFLPRAYRRPVKPAAVAPIVKLVAEELEHGASFENAIKVGLVAVLTSPRFLYLAEPAGDEKRALSDFELATRLSYFLWSSMPDEPLFEAARAGKLHDPAEMAAQIDRMLTDPKSSALVTGFGAQWLRTEQFRTFAPDPKIYKLYNEKLGEAMVSQTLTFFEEVLRKDRSLIDLLDSDWTMLNAPLAAFYGISGVEGNHFRRVQLPPDSPRGGLLGQAGVALYGSDGARTKPVRRGVYVREVFFNDPPDPPPPNVGEIEPNIQGKNLTVRDRLLAHQQIEACAACHRGIDPYGLGLENFNVIGAWRDKQDGEDFRGPKSPPIDPSGRLPNGKEFQDFAAYKALLVEQKERFSRAVAEKLFVYALGRPAEASDRSTLDGMTRQMAANGYTLRGLIKALAATPQFATK